MSQSRNIEKLLKDLDSDEIAGLLRELRKRDDIIIPSCYTPDELCDWLRSEGWSEELSEDLFHRVRSEFFNSVEGFIRELMRTVIMISLDNSRETVQQKMAG